MKLIYIHQYFLFPEDSGGTRSYDLAKSFVNKGFEVEVITTSSFIKNYDFQNKWTIIERDDIKIHVLKLDYSNDLSYLKRIYVFLQFLYFSTLRALIINCDLILATSTPLTIGIPALIKKWRYKTPYIFEVRDVWPEAVIAIGAIKNKIVQKLLYGLEKKIYKNAAAIVPLSSDMKKSIVFRYPDICKNKPVVVIENISEINRFSKAENSNILKAAVGFQPRFTVLYAGTFGRVNGINYVVDIAKKTIVEDPSIVFVLVGDGAMKEQVIQYAKDEEVLNKNVFILDSVSKKDLPNLYQAVDMGSSFVISIKELWANSANKFFDTLAAGKPLLINHPGWQKETIERENVGYVLPEVVTDEMAKEFVNYTLDVEKVKQQQSNAIKLAKNKYSLEVAVEKYIKLFEAIDYSKNV